MASGSLAVESGELSPLDRGSSWYDPIFAKDDASVFAAGADAFIARLPFDSRTGKLRAQRVVMPIRGRAWRARPVARRPTAAGSPSPGCRSTARSGRSTLRRTERRRGRRSQSPATPAGANRCRCFRLTGRRSPTCPIRQGELPNIWVMDADGSESDSAHVRRNRRSQARVVSRWPPRGLHVETRRGRRSCGRSTSTPAARSWCLILPEPEKYPTLTGRLAEFQLSPSITQIAFSLLTPPTGRAGPLCRRRPSRSNRGR